MLQSIPANTEGIKASTPEIKEDKPEPSTNTAETPFIANPDAINASMTAETTKTVATIKGKRKTEEQQLLEIRPNTVADDDAEVEIVPN